MGKRKEPSAEPVGLEGTDAPDEDAAGAAGPESSDDELPAKEATAEELKAEVSRQSDVLGELFPELGKGGKGRGRGRGGRPTAAPSGFDGLLVSRFVPGGVAAPAAPAATPGSAPSADAGSGKKQKRKAAVDGAKLVEVKSNFARVFKGGPKRKEADLPEQEDEGLEEAPPPPEEKDAGAGEPWLSSLLGEAAPVAEAEEAEEGDEAEAEAKPAKAKPVKDKPAKDKPAKDRAEDVDLDEAEDEPEAAEEGRQSAEQASWLFTLGGQGTDAPSAREVKAAVGELRMTEAVKRFAGKALPIPPFWRTESLEDLMGVLETDRQEMLYRIKRMAKKSQKRAQTRRERPVAT